jgi:ATP-dependent Clp protease ATP-binding subunit ClpB
MVPEDLGPVTFGRESVRILSAAGTIAAKHGHDFMGTGHLLLALLESDSQVLLAVLHSSSIDSNELQRASRNHLAGIISRGVRGMPIRPSQGLLRASEHARQEALRRGQNEVRAEHLLLGLILDHAGDASKLLSTAGITSDAIRDAITGSAMSKRTR